MGRVLAATFATLAASLSLVSPAHAARVNTFQGECSGMSGTAAFPDTRLRAIPTSMRTVIAVSGGSCRGTLNGERIDAPGFRGDVEIRGRQSCSVAVAHGRGRFVIGGRVFLATAHYRRVGTTPVVHFEGDAGGDVVVVVRATVGPEDFESLSRRCLDEGLPDIGIFVERFAAPQSISSPEPRSARKPKSVEGSGRSFRDDRAR